MHIPTAPTLPSRPLPIYRQLYFQVIVAIVLGAILGHYEPLIGEKMKPLGDAFINLVKMIIAPELLDSAMVGLIGVGVDGRQAWENGVAQSLLGAGRSHEFNPAQMQASRLGLAWAQLAALPDVGAAPLTLPNGLLVWARAEMRARDGRRGLIPAAQPSAVAAADKPAPVTDEKAAAPPAQAPSAAMVETPVNTEAPPAVSLDATPRLRESDLDLIQRTLLACGGNVSDAAARLGVSRGLIYRRLRAANRTGHAPAP
jgi:sigma-54 dependent transcriptional regulator, acetoin dehydrogenase operon transcriptional activator AcoR